MLTISLHRMYRICRSVLSVCIRRYTYAVDYWNGHILLVPRTIEKRLLCMLVVLRLQKVPKTLSSLYCLLAQSTYLLLPYYQFQLVHSVGMPVVSSSPHRSLHYSSKHSAHYWQCRLYDLHFQDEWPPNSMKYVRARIILSLDFTDQLSW